MTIEKGKPWGSPGTVPNGAAWADDDAAVAASRSTVVQPLGGNLWLSLGCPARKSAGEDCMMLPIDAMRCTVNHDGGSSVVTAVAEVVVGSWFGRGGMRVITNVGVHGKRNLAPRAHPNDGEFDILEIDASTSLRQRILARRRTLTGTHVPHPTVSVRRGVSTEIVRTGGQELVIDGRPFGKWTSVRVDIQPDFMTVLV